MQRLRRLLTRHWLLTLLIMGISALICGLSSIDLFMLLKENLSLIASGQLLFDGALQQLSELLGDGVISIVFYVIFKACEKALVEQLLK